MRIICLMAMLVALAIPSLITNSSASGAVYTGVEVHRMDLEMSGLVE